MLTRLDKVEDLKHLHHLSRVPSASLSTTLQGLCSHSCSTVKLHLKSTVCNYIHMYIINLLCIQARTCLYMNIQTVHTGSCIYVLLCKYVRTYVQTFLYILSTLNLSGLLLIHDFYWPHLVLMYNHQISLLPYIRTYVHGYSVQ